jgi:hypothetical protein
MGKHPPLHFERRVNFAEILIAAVHTDPQYLREISGAIRVFMRRSLAKYWPATKPHERYKYLISW